MKEPYSYGKGLGEMKLGMGSGKRWKARCDIEGDLKWTRVEWVVSLSD
jgi:hypothetical protein